MKVKIEFEIDAIPNKVVDMWLEKITLPIRINRHLVPGSWKLEIEDTAPVQVCRCGKPMDMHFDSRDTNLPPGAVISHPGTLRG